MSAFLAMNTPITLGMLMSPPTAKWIAFWQFVNQSYMAALNYHNRNESSIISNREIFKGFSMAVGSAIIVALTLRRLTSRIKVSGLILNAGISSVASSCAGVCNTVFMRQAEIKQGIDYYSSPDLNPDSKIGVSTECAKKAIF